MTYDRVPYPGLRAFEPQESDLFFGRDGCVDEMLQTLAATRMLAVLGTSGSGKSSLVRTGLFDALELGFLEGQGHQWLFADMHPGGRPLQNLAQALLPKAATALEHNLLESFLRRGPRSLVQWCQDGNLPAGTGLLLLVDQFEELFRYQDYAGRESAEAFVALLLECLRSELPIYVVVTMRSEYLGACALMPGLAEQMNKSLYLTRRMTREECREAIEGPAKVCGFQIEPRLVTHVLNDLSNLAPWEGETDGGSLSQLAKRADQLPLMQHALNRLWQRAKEVSGDADLVLSYDAYQALGGLRGALDAHASGVMDALPAAWTPMLEPVFRALMTGNSINDAVRHPRRLEELVALAGDEDAARGIVDAFRAEHCSFLRPPAGQKLDMQTIIDFSHESIIRQWSVMEGWLQTEVRSTAIWQRLVASSEAYAAGQGDLLRGLDLANARDWWDKEKPREAWADQKGGDFKTVLAFLEKSHDKERAEAEALAAREQRERRNLRVRAGVYLGAAILSLGAAFLAFDARQDALLAQNEALLQKGEAEEERAITLEAADDFLVNLAVTLNSSIGVPRDDVNTLFARAEQFLDTVEERAGQAPGLTTLRARLHLERADDLLARDEIAPAMEQAQAASDLITALVAEAGYTEQALLLAFRITGFELGEAWRQKDIETIAQLDKDRRDLLAAQAHLLSPHDRAYWEIAGLRNQYYQSNEEENWQRAISLAEACLEKIPDLDNDRFDQSRWGLKCQHNLLYATNEAEAPVKALIEALDQAALTISFGDKSRDDWNDWARAQGLIAGVLGDAGEHELAVERLDNITERLTRLTEIEPDEPAWKVNLARAYLNTGYHLSKLGEVKSHLDVSLKSAAIFDALAPTFRRQPARAEDALVVYNNIRITSDRSGLTQRAKDDLDQIAEVHEQRIKTTNLLVDIGHKTDCEGCTFPMYAELLDVHVARLKRGDVTAADDVLTVYARGREAMRDHLSMNRFDVTAVNARNAFSVMTNNLFSGLVAHRASVADDALLAYLIRAEAIWQHYQTLFPRDHAVAHRYGDLLVHRADIEWALGRREQAARTIQSALATGSYNATVRLLDWYKTGEGPVQQDAGKAAALSELLRQRAPVLQVQLFGRWLGALEDDPTARQILTFVPADLSMSPIDEILWNVQHLQGTELLPSEVSKLRELASEAQGSDIPFPLYVAKALTGVDYGLGLSMEDLKSSFYAGLAGKTEEDAFDLQTVQVFARFGGAPALRPNVLRTLRDIIRDKTHPDYDVAMNQLVYLPGLLWGAPRMDNMSNNMNAAVIDDLAAEMLDLYAQELPNMKRKHQAAFLSTWGGTQDLVGEPVEAQRGRVAMALGAALDPGAGEIWNDIGYTLLEDKVLKGIAPKLLERAALAVEPGSQIQANTLDSLGWALFLNGRPEEALEKIERSLEIATEPSADVHYHLAEVQFALGRKDQARLALADALKDHLFGDVLDDARAFNEKLHQATQYDAETRSAARTIAARIKANPPNESRVSVDRAGIALRGFDPVALRKTGSAQPGALKYFVLYQDAVWLFASQDNRAAFEGAPERFAPAFGGFSFGKQDAILGSREHAFPAYSTVFDDTLVMLRSEEEVDRFAQIGAVEFDRLKTAWELDDHDWQPGPSAPSLFEPLLLETLAGFD